VIFDHDNDPLAAAKGIALGVAAGAIIWVVVYLLIRAVA